MSKLRKAVRSYASEAQERAYWERPNSAADRDWGRAKRVRLANPRPGATAISPRLPISLLEDIKIAANKRDAPCQSPIEMWLSEKAG